MRIKRHQIRLRQVVKMQFDHKLSMIEHSMNHAASNPSNLGHIVDDAWYVLQCGSVVAPTSAVIVDAVKIGAESCLAFFRKAMAGTQPLTVQLGNRSAFQCQGYVDESMIHSGRWITGFFFAILANLSEVIQGLNEIPTALLQQSSTTTDLYLDLTVDVLKATWQQASSIDRISEQLRKRMQEKEPTEWDVHIGFPAVAFLLSLNEAASTHSEVLLHALQLHKSYYSTTENRMHDPAGFVAFQLLGLTCLASHKGISINVKSEYLPLSAFAR